MSVTIRDRTDYVEMVSTPQPMPLAFSPGGFYRIVAKIACRACGRMTRHCVRSPRYMRGRDGEPLHDLKGRRITLAPPDPSAVETVSSLLLHATDHLTGCWNNPVSDLGMVSDLNRPGRHTRKGKCGLYGHKTCVCGYVWSVHKKGCPTAMIPRFSPMVVTGMSSATQVRKFKRELA